MFRSKSLCFDDMFYLKLLQHLTLTADSSPSESKVNTFFAVDIMLSLYNPGTPISLSMFFFGIVKATINFACLMFSKVTKDSFLKTIYLP